MQVLKTAFLIYVQHPPPPRKWPNVQTLFTLASVITTVAEITLKRSTWTIAGLPMENSWWLGLLNGSIRVVSMGTALYQKRYYKFMFDFPIFEFRLGSDSLKIDLLYLRVASIGLDLISESYNFCTSERKKGPSFFSASRLSTSSSQELVRLVSRKETSQPPKPPNSILFKLKKAFGLQKKSIEDFATITPEKLITIRLNPKDLGEACRLLNVPYPNDMDPNEFIDLAEKKHSLFVTTLTKKQSMVSQIFSDSMQILIDDAHIALQTVKESVRQRSFS